MNEYIRRIERKYYDSCSVGYQRWCQRHAELTASRFGIGVRAEPCEHIPGRTYDGKLCEYDIDEAHLREVSLVPSGSNPDAKLLDRKRLGRRATQGQGGRAGNGAGDGTSDPKTLLGT